MGDGNEHEDIISILKGKKIFLVEDDIFLAQLLVRKIASVEVDVSSFEDGETAVESLKRETPDLLLLDLMLPQMSGFDVLKFVREHEATKKIPVLVLSNTDQMEDKNKVRELGAEFVTKALVSPETILKYCGEMIRDGKIIHEELI